MRTCDNNPEKSSTIKINKNTPCGYSLLTNCSFDLTISKLDRYNYLWKKEMISLTDEENKSYKKQKICYIFKKGFSTDDDNKKHHKSVIIVTTQDNKEELLIVIVI